MIRMYSANLNHPVISAYEKTGEEPKKKNLPYEGTDAGVCFTVNIPDQ